MAARKKSTATATATPAPIAAALAAPERITEPVPLDTIYVREGFNARQTIDRKKLADLADSMATVGQLEDVLLAPRTVPDPLGATPPKQDGWYLVAGHRRYLAALELKWTHIRASYVPAEPDSRLAADVMGHENAARDELSHADRIRYIVKALAAGEGADVLAKRFRISVTTVRNDNLIGTKLDPAIFDAWAKHPQAASSIALRLYARAPEEQRRMWDEWVANMEREAKEVEARGGKRKRGKRREDDDGAARRPLSEVRAAIGEMTDKAKAAGKGLDAEVAAFVAGAEWALAFLEGARGVPRDIMSELAKGVKAAKPDPRQLTLKGTGKGKGGK